MWSPTTSSNTKKVESENITEKEVVEEPCTCASGGPPTQQQLNVFKSSSKKTELRELAVAETSDSGFISGPQISANQDDSDDSDNSVKLNISLVATPPTTTAAAAQQQHKKLTTENIAVLDSGCIDDEDFAEETNDDDDNDDADDSHEKKSDEQQQQNQVQREHSSPTVAIAASAAGTKNDRMILQHSVDAGMSEWFCNMSLQSSDTLPRPQSQQMLAADIAMNNLNAAGRRIAANSLNQRSTPTATNTATANTPTTPNLTPLNAWEQFYQQNDDGDTPLHLACISGYVDVVAALIRMAPHPCLFNIQNDEAQTPLHLAALTVQPKILRMLLIAGAEPTLRDRHGNTALHLSCLSGEEQCVRALTIPISASEINEAHRLYGHRSNDKTVSYLSYARLPSDLEIRNYDGERCVHLAAQSGHIDILRILVLYGADINAREGKSGRTPLHIAIECCNEDLANFLLDDCQKVNLETATYAGLTAYQVACILNKSQMQNILEKRGAETLTPPDSDYDSDIETDLDEVYDRFGDPGYFVGYNGGNPMTVA